MNDQEKIVHQIAFEAASHVEQLLAFPKGKRALQFFELYQLVRRGLAEYSQRSDWHYEQLTVATN